MKFLLEIMIYCICFSLICVLLRGRDGKNMLMFYPKELKRYAIKKGIATKKELRRRFVAANILLAILMTANLYLIVCVWNHKTIFSEILVQNLIILQVWNIYDGIVMDKIWPEHSDFWIMDEMKHLWKGISFKELLLKRIIYIPITVLWAYLAALVFHRIIG
ncbi:MAG: hypothetical protein Q4P28_05880 [Tissierellia bacterium]|nr:hypothetical protein [Tissierellia bacterium]